MIYAGIGSRRTPPEILEAMELLAFELSEDGWTLRSGHAPGADQAFERGAHGRAEVYLPWSSFEADVPVYGRRYDRPSALAHDVAEKHHHRWEFLRPGARLLHARNAHQILGHDLATPADAVVCWTPDGSVDGEGPDTGGTGQALRIATAHGVPVLNLRSRFLGIRHPQEPAEAARCWLEDTCL